MLTFRIAAPYVLLAILAAWLWWPALSPVPVEGFSAMIASGGIGLQSGTLALVDPVYPFDTEFYFLSRLGANAGVALLVSLGFGGLLALQVLTGLSFVILAVTSFLFARQWTHAPAVLVLFVLVLIPGFGESAFFLHENMLAAALLTAAMVLVGANQSMASAALAGLLLGAALLTRSDIVLFVPALPLILWAKVGVSRQFLRALVAGGVVTGATFLGALLLVGVTPLDLLAVLQRSVLLWTKGQSLAMPMMKGLFFIGIPALILLLAGLWPAWRGSSWAKRLLLLGVPMLFLVVYGDKLWETRQFLALLPFVVALVSLGAMLLWRLLPSRLGRGAAWAALAAISLVPTPVMFFDGPRVVTGKLLNPPAWSAWQALVQTNLRTISDGIDSLPQGGMILTDDWNTDRYTHLALQDAGYRPVMDDSCGHTVETFVRGETTIRHVRLHLPFFVDGNFGRSELLARFESQCLPGNIDKPLLLMVAGPQHESKALSDSMPPPIIATIRAKPITVADLATLAQHYRDQVGDKGLTAAEVDDLTAQLAPITPLLR